MAEERAGDEGTREERAGEEGARKVSSEEARRALASNEAHAVDIRDEEGWRSGHIPGAHHIPEDELPQRAEDFPTEGEIIIAAEDEEQAARAAGALREAGREAVVLEGGMDSWRSEDQPMQPSRDPEEDTPI
jgi:rhodanese-related sulfurtransferase